jgi:hypothetical protein
MAVARIAVGLGGAHFYLSNLHDRSFLFGPDGYMGPAPFPVPFDAFYAAGSVVAFAFAVRGGRLLATAHALCFWTLYARNPNLMDGGDTFGRYVAVMMIMAVTDAYFAPGAGRRRKRTPRAPVAHNTAVALIVVQTATVYTLAGVYKLADPAWRSGTALHAIAQLADYRFIDVVPFLEGTLLVSMLTYGVVALEVSFVPLVSTRLRPYAIGSMFVMHVVLAATMGLVGFAIHMSAGLALIWLSDPAPLLDPDEERIVRLAPPMDLDLDVELRSEAFAELVRVPLVHVSAVDERDQ